MKLALGFNPVLGIRESAKIASRAEKLGFDSVWMHESLFQRDVVTYLSAMASATHRIRLGSGVINTFTRHPVTAATTFATLSELSEGRVNLGLGVGSFPTIPLIGEQIFPVKKTRPLRRVKEYVDVVKMVWEGDRVEFDGEFFHVHNLTMGFKAEADIPIYIASLSPQTQAFAATVADGVILSPALNTAWGTRRMVENVERGEAKRGRQVERASYMLTSLDPDPEKAAGAVRDYYFFVYQLSEVVKAEVLAPYGVTDESLRPMKEAWKRGDVPEAKRLIPDRAIEVLTVSGTGDHAAERLKEYAREGVTLPIAMPIGNVEYTMEQLSRVVGP
ncbi:MAG: LLM class flavin-dependent oxidoreductase [Nitrososphaerota archaeon]|nr:LLM class flavin-dependent oxidoreductase [Nitrososphaerota archaeon]MDG7010730.1 LLM class flavin-dependent oxidoreductase [Nitrososphaerota archaeon]